MQCIMGLIEMNRRNRAPSMNPFFFPWEGFVRSKILPRVQILQLDHFACRETSDEGCR